MSVNLQPSIQHTAMTCVKKARIDYDDDDGNGGGDDDVLAPAE